jgi:hypothetical protein
MAWRQMRPKSEKPRAGSFKLTAAALYSDFSNQRLETPDNAKGDAKWPS